MLITEVFKIVKYKKTLAEKKYLKKYLFAGYHYKTGVLIPRSARKTIMKRYRKSKLDGTLYRIKKRK